MNKAVAILGVALLTAAVGHGAQAEQRQTSVTIYTSPEMNLGEIDREIIDQVGSGGSINFAAFILSDYSIMNALRAAALRGAHIRLYLDPEELSRLKLSPDHPFAKLTQTDRHLFRHFELWRVATRRSLIACQDQEAIQESVGKVFGPQ